MRLTKDNCVYSFSCDHVPACSITAPAQITLETRDCYGDQLRGGSGNPEIEWDHVNPTTGPVFVEGAQPGDTLKVTIDAIDVADFGVACNEDEIRLLSVDGGYADFLGRFKIPLNKMIGVIGVAPAPEEGAVNNATPGRHGANMDERLIGEGAVLYLPVFVEGALFAVGDVHAIMGDGEVGGTGLEIPAEVTVTLDVIKGWQPAWPLVETDEVFAFVVSKETMDEAIDEAVLQMHGFLKNWMADAALTDEDLYILMSLVGQVGVSQIVDPLKTARFVFPKKYMDMET